MIKWQSMQSLPDSETKDKRELLDGEMEVG